MDNGRSLLPILTGDTDPARHRDHVRCEYYDALNMYLPSSRAATRRAGPPCTAPTATSWSPTTASTTANSTTWNSTPWELTNLWDDPSAAALRADLIQRSFDATAAASDPGPAQIGRF